MSMRDKPDESLRRGAGDFGAFKEGDLLAGPTNEGLKQLAADGHRRELQERGEPYSHAPDSGPVTTQVADGLPRRAWTVEEVERMVEHGVLREPEPFELIGGELVAMAPKDRRHEVLRTELALYWARRMGSSLKVVSESPLRLGQHDAPEPDVIVFPAGLLAPDVRADTVLLVVEVANSSLPTDMHIKAPRYAAAGVREYWVIDARSLVTTVHRDPQPNAEYADRKEHAASETLTPMLAPSLAVRITDLGLG
jgi:Uma2 family endonuclease